jgi:hypothetical protein
MLGSARLEEFRELSSQYFSAQVAGIPYSVELNIAMDGIIRFMQERTCVRSKVFKRDILSSTDCCLNPICDVCSHIHRFCPRSPCEGCVIRKNVSRMFRALQFGAGGAGGAGGNGN